LLQPAKKERRDAMAIGWRRRLSLKVRDVFPGQQRTGSAAGGGSVFELRKGTPAPAAAAPVAGRGAPAAVAAKPITVADRKNLATKVSRAMVDVLIAGAEGNLRSTFFTLGQEVNTELVKVSDMLTALEMEKGSPLVLDDIREWIKKYYG
jgi:hypothetical protein